MTVTRPAATISCLAVTGLLLVACSSASSPHESSPPARRTHGSQTLALPSPSEPGTGASTPTTAALPDACKLLTKAEAEKLTGVHMQPPDDTPARDPVTDIASCTYDAIFTGPSGQVSVFVQAGMPHALAVDRAIHHKFRTLPGIADQTLEEPDNQSIFIRKGRVWVYVQASNSSPAALERTARTIATRLP